MSNVCTIPAASSTREALIRELRAEMEAAPPWKRSTAWYADRQAALDRLQSQPAGRVRKPPTPQVFTLMEAPSHDTDGYFAFDVADGRGIGRYVAHEIPADGGRGFQVEKLDALLWTVESYHVFLAADGVSHSCECKGFLRWGSEKPCRHVAALMQFVGEGQLPVNRPRVLVDVRAGLVPIHSCCPSCHAAAPAGELCDPCEREEPAFVAAHFGRARDELRYVPDEADEGECGYAQQAQMDFEAWAASRDQPDPFDGPYAA